MSVKNFQRNPSFFLFLLLVSPAIAQQSASQVNFTLGLDTSIDAGLNYTQYVAGDTGPQSRFVIGFNITINSVDGNPVNVGPIAAFCSELQEPIGESTYTFTAAPLRGLAAGQGGWPGTASSGIPPNGIGPLRAARLAYLFDHHYTSVNLSEWPGETPDERTTNIHAFQLAVWEVTHDTDLSLSDTSGLNYLGAQTGGSNPSLRSDAVNLAQSWLNGLNDANVNASYRSDTFEFWALTSTTGNAGSGGPGFQDVILASLKNSPEAELLAEYIVVPEPGMLGCVALVMAVSLVASRIGKHKRSRARR